MNPHVNPYSGPFPEKPITFAVNADGKYAMSGFEDVDVWAMLNDPLWREVTNTSRQMRLCETDRLKALLCALLKDRHGQSKAAQCSA